MARTRVTIQRPISSWTDGPSIIWNGPHLGGDLYSSVNVTLSATDQGGSGVDKTYYTTDGSDPTGSSTVSGDHSTGDSVCCPAASRCWTK